MFTSDDIVQLNAIGIDQEQVKAQVHQFEEGFPFLHIMKAATVAEGIIRLEEDDVADHVKSYKKLIAGRKVMKFVPASGAASRMFKELFACLNAPDELPTPAVQQFFDQLPQFAFYPLLKESFDSQNISLEDSLANHDYSSILEGLLAERGLNYGGLPKGLLAFHQYDREQRTPVEEHLVEAAHYGKSSEGKAHLHFTISPQHELLFKELLDQSTAAYEKTFNVNFEISFSQQKPTTDTVAVDPENKPFRNPDGSLLFRPGGHGALLENLNEIDADLIFIKNVDNVVPDRLKSVTYQYKMALGSVLLKFQEKLFAYLEILESGDHTKIGEIEWFLSEDMNVKQPEGYAKIDRALKVEYLRSKLNRPIRVCGMVKNEGEPGGGPFWAQNKDGSVSLQIVESSQIDMKDFGQQEIVKNATHFNPVDLVCGVKDFKGNKFDLLQFRDSDTGFISEKSKDGKALKAMELPGLWNGAMADWNTLFVEVPLITFNPVKTVNDLLREEHQ
ncbi:MAG: DUF4301 family protein [Cyclobacteriaceae bacterium]